MRFALVNSSRVEAEPGLKGICPGCLKSVIPKCGTQRIHHWAHKTNKSCDIWWEPETDWHRSWKNNFPLEWQEKFLPDEKTGEKHIADVYTSHGLVIEFQHSHIEPQERKSRESFYENMVWVVNGSRRKADFSRFIKRIKHFKYLKKDLFRVDRPEDCFPSAWLESSVPVVFDFKSNDFEYDPIIMKNNLYCLFPIRIGGYVTVAEMSREGFINTTTNGKWIFRTRQFIDDLRRESDKWQYDNAALRLQYMLNDMISKGFTIKPTRGRRL